MCSIDTLIMAFARAENRHMYPQLQKQGAGGMVQWLGALATLEEERDGSQPSITPVPAALTSSSAMLRHQTHRWYIQSHTGKQNKIKQTKTSYP